MKKYFAQVTIFLTVKANSTKEVEKIVKEKFTGYDPAIEIMNKRRTSQQNAALHLFFTQLAETLNDKGFYMNKVLKGSTDVIWTPLLVKEIMWKPLQKAMFGKKSTTALLKMGQIDKIYDVINKVVSERTDGEVYIPFPSIEEVMSKEQNV